MRFLSRFFFLEKARVIYLSNRLQMCQFHLSLGQSFFVNHGGRLQPLPPFSFNFEVSFQLTDFLLFGQNRFLGRVEAAQSTLSFYFTLNESVKGKKSKQKIQQDGCHVPSIGSQKGTIEKNAMNEWLFSQMWLWAAVQHARQADVSSKSSYG